MIATATCPTCGHTRRTGGFIRARNSPGSQRLRKALYEAGISPRVANRIYLEIGDRWDTISELARAVIINDLKRSGKR